MAKKNKHIENYLEVQKRGRRLEALFNLSNDILEKERHVPILFNDFLYMAAKTPEFVFRDIFQLFYDMVRYYVPNPVDEYPKTKESIGFVKYDFYNLFEKGSEDPFFADRIFANRFMKLTEDFRKGVQNNRIYFFEGPPGSGKSTFLNNLLRKLEDYCNTPEGTLYVTHWNLDIEKLGGFQRFERVLEEVEKNEDAQNGGNEKLSASLLKLMRRPSKSLNFSCPNRDHPILQIPKDYRKRFLNELISDEEIKHKLYHDKQYDWVLRGSPCSICSSIYNTLLDTLNEPLEIYNMINARRAKFSRMFGEGISIYNPGDPVVSEPILNSTLQTMIHDLLKSDDVTMLHSALAKTNNGVLALMDIKEQNIQRLKNLHGIISDGVHKVGIVEEKIKSLFVGLVNPEDKKHYENIKSFQDRIITTRIPYILDYTTEVAIYKNKFGKSISESFLPGVLNNFAKIVISTRLNHESPTIKNWLKSPKNYSTYLDKNFILLKMEIYAGKIPNWLSEEDIKGFDKTNRKSLIGESESEGFKGISGRKSLNLFNMFFSKYGKEGSPITMDLIKRFFSSKTGDEYGNIPIGFVDSLEDLYDYSVLQEVKESVYYYNAEQITKDILNYLFAINFDPGETKKSLFTGDKIDITEDYFKNIEAVFLGTTSSEYARKSFRKDVLAEYITKTISQEINIQGKEVNETELFTSLFEKYTRNLKQNALAPYAQNENFRRAILDYQTDGFATYDSRLKKQVKFLISNLQKKFRYTEKGAKQVAVYVFDKGLAGKY